MLNAEASRLLNQQPRKKRWRMDLNRIIKRRKAYVIKVDDPKKAPVGGRGNLAKKTIKGI